MNFTTSTMKDNRCPVLNTDYFTAVTVAEHQLLSSPMKRCLLFHFLFNSYSGHIGRISRAWIVRVHVHPHPGRLW